MSFQPMTAVHLLSGVPLDNTYTHTFSKKFFPTRSAQTAYFMGKQVSTAVDLTYQRENLYVDYPAEYDEVYKCNYLMFQNESFNQNWIYAFITRMEYYNEGLTRIYFEVDAWQTYMFDVEIKQCMVEREHVENDAIGANLLDEGLPLGDYIINSTTEKMFQEWWIVIGSTVVLDPESEDFLKPASGDFYNNVYSGVKYYVFDEAEQLTALFRVLDTQKKSDAITTIFMLPTDVVTNTTPFTELNVTPKIMPRWSLPVTNTLNGYTPKNNKLLCYPYRGCVVTNNNGATVGLKYEFFNNLSPAMQLDGSLSADGRIMATPVNYKGKLYNYDEGIQIGNFPICSWYTNVYYQWLANNQITSSLGMLTAGLALGGAALSGNPVAIAGASMGAINAVGKQFAEREQAKLEPPAAKGHSGGESFFVGLYQYGFVAQCVTIPYDIAKSNDDYLSRYGYRVDKLKVPNTTNRPSWNYVKCNEPVIVGNCNSTYLEILRNTMVRGITFWHGDYIGDYSRDNSGSTPPIPDTYQLIVNGGSGDGYYTGGTIVPIVADTQVNFKNWSTNDGGIIENPNSYATNYTMPSNPVTITANYEEPIPSDRIDTYAKQFIGAVEWDDTVRLWQVWYYGSYVKDAWCCTYLTYCAAMSGYGSQVPKNAAVQSLYNAMNAQGRTWEATAGSNFPKPGDVCFFITPESTTVLHHCGVVSAVDEATNTVTYTSGNTSNPSGGPDGVFEKKTVIGQGGTYYVKYFGRVDYT